MTKAISIIFDHLDQKSVTCDTVTTAINNNQQTHATPNLEVVAIGAPAHCPAVSGITRWR